MFASVWRPELPDSIDGKPLAEIPLDFVTDFPYERLPSSRFVAFFLRPEVPILLILGYFISEAYLPQICEAFGINGKSTLYKTSVALHNLLLAVFSAVVLVNSWPIVIQHYTEKGFHASYCDPDGSFWSSSGFGAWATIFYLSKYYEFIDTYVLIGKGKKPSFLQLYHHAGIVITMWGAVVSHSAWLQVVVLLNSFIHTLMYTYFFLKTIDPKRQIKGAKYLTTAQIVQFYTGILYTIPVHFLGESCDSSASRAVALFIHLYAVGLIFLFTAFAKRKYKKV